MCVSCHAPSRRQPRSRPGALPCRPTPNRQPPTFTESCALPSAPPKHAPTTRQAPSPVSRPQSTWASATPRLRSWPHVAKAHSASALEASSATPLTSWRRGSGRTTRASCLTRGTTRHRAGVRETQANIRRSRHRYRVAGVRLHAQPGPLAKIRADRTRAFERDLGPSATRTLKVSPPAHSHANPAARPNRTRGGVGVILRTARFHAHRPSP
jgi:hypothetical protein